MSIGLAQSHLVLLTCSFLINAIPLPEWSGDVRSWLHAKNATLATEMFTGKMGETFRGGETDILHMAILCEISGEVNKELNLHVIYVLMHLKKKKKI